MELNPMKTKKIKVDRETYAKIAAILNSVKERAFGPITPEERKEMAKRRRRKRKAK